MGGDDIAVEKLGDGNTYHITSIVTCVIGTC